MVPPTDVTLREVVCQLQNHNIVASIDLLRASAGEGGDEVGATLGLYSRDTTIT